MLLWSGLIASLIVAVVVADRRRLVIVTGSLWACLSLWSFFSSGPHTLLPLIVALTAGTLLGRLIAHRRGRHRQALVAVAEAEADLSQERSRLRLEAARELHDTVGHHLSVVSMYSNLASASTTSGGGLSYRAEIRETVQKAEQSLRALGRRLHRPSTSTHEAANSPGDLVIGHTSLLQRAGFTVHTDLDSNEVVLGEESLDALQRFFQEGTTNILRYAEAGTCEISSSSVPGRSSWTISSPSSDPRSDSQGLGLGILGLRERAVRAGGFLTHSWEAGRWQLSLDLPSVQSNPTRRSIVARWFAALTQRLGRVPHALMWAAQAAILLDLVTDLAPLADRPAALAVRLTQGLACSAVLLQARASLALGVLLLTLVLLPGMRFSIVDFQVFSLATLLAAQRWQWWLVALGSHTLHTVIMMFIDPRFAGDQFVVSLVLWAIASGIGWLLGSLSAAQERRQAEADEALRMTAELRQAETARLEHALGQSIMNGLTAMQEILDRADADDAKTAIAAIGEHSRRVMAELRTLVFSLRAGEQVEEDTKVPSPADLQPV